jgi:tetratricopeptide (TPR) repeat protein
LWAVKVLDVESKIAVKDVLEILKEAYSKLAQDKEVIGTAKRIAQAYVQVGQLSSAILEYETILQRYPDDPDVREALKEIESKAASFASDEAFIQTIKNLARIKGTPLLITLAGPTAAGKTEITERLMDAFEKEGKNL